jgi:hypothetical protein
MSASRSRVLALVPGAGVFAIAATLSSLPSRTAALARGVAQAAIARGTCFPWI